VSPDVLDLAAQKASKPRMLERLEPYIPYEYTPLQFADSIRLLVLHSGEKSSPIRISLREVGSTDESEYEALSYTWATEDGDATLSSVISCNGAHIGITKNCENALRRIRNRDSHRVLWVDTICINQRDEKERSHQVGLMRDVYNKASQVLIWLGESSKKIDEETGLPVSDIFMRYLPQMADEIRRLNRVRDHTSPSPLLQELLSQAHSDALGEKKSSLWDGLWDFQSRRWWGRIWVVQEVAYAKSAILICGEQTANYSDFFDSYEAMRKYLDIPEIKVIWDKMDASREHLRTVRLSRRLFELNKELFINYLILQRARHLQASDPRDKIFAIIGLVEGFTAMLPLPDYSQNQTQVFTAVVKSFLKHSKMLYILTQAAATQFTSHHPSWVPDWTMPAIMPALMPDVFLEQEYPLYNAAGHSDAVYEISSDNKELRLKGEMVDFVEKISLGKPVAYKSRTRAEKRIQDWQTSCRLGSSLKNYPTGESVQEALWRTLCWNVAFQNTYPHMYPVQDPLKSRDQFRKWYHILMSCNDLDRLRIQLCAQAESFGRYVYDQTPLCITGKGFLASVPYTTKPGDTIAVLTGGPVPFVLRPTRNHYRLVGHCYVHGIMNGEAFPKDPNKLDWISIR
jgi:hypothetical protein